MTLQHFADAYSRNWHKADIEEPTANVRFWGKSEHQDLTLSCPLLTQSGHRANLLHRTRAASRPRDVCLFSLSFWEPKITVNALVGERLMDRLVAHLNIEHYRKALANEFDETKRQNLIGLIGEEELKLAEALQKEDREKQRGPQGPSNATAAQSKARLFGLQLRPSVNDSIPVR